MNRLEDVEPSKNASVLDAEPEMIRPPINRLMKVLDRSFFQKNQRLCAAQILDPKDIATFQAELRRDLLQLARVKSIVSVPDQGRQTKALILRPGIKSEDKQTWSERLRELNDAQRIKLIDYDLNLDYNVWNYREIMDAVLPADLLDDELPSSFAIVGHVAHLNLRDQFLPYKTLIAQVIMDKNLVIRSVINKIDEVGENSDYRTFEFELLAGNPDMNVEVKAENCFFNFDFSKVYYNPRLNTEHRRMIGLFKLGEAVCDVMAGIGPFAVPSGKKDVFVWANDLNPDSFSSLQHAIKRNKVHQFVKPFCTDGKAFIRQATTSLAQSNFKAIVPCKPSDLSRSTSRKDPKAKNSPSKTGLKKVYIQPRIFSHYVMNLPASASTFLPSFIGLFLNLDYLFTKPYPDPSVELEMPMIHLYCFSTKSDDNAAEKIKIYDEISHQLDIAGHFGESNVEIHPVRDVAPHKRMFCASFRLPAEVAFRRPEGGTEVNDRKTGM